MDNVANAAGTPNIPAAGQPTEAYKIHLLITRDEEEGFSAIALNLPGAGSCGDTEEEAVENAREAIRGVLESYKAGGGPIPWTDTRAQEVPLLAAHQWITVNA